MLGIVFMVSPVCSLQPGARRSGVNLGEYFLASGRRVDGCSRASRNVRCASTS